ncbi:MAG: hypothetical protein JJT77_02095 [Crocinitomicaceae bacterium]|nr:hypothetical protein [Crocinitomicaceae bacterium]
MGAPVEHITDLGLVNYVPHPDNSNYVVFRFPDIERANDFEAALKAQNIWYERDQQQGRTRMFYLFAVKQQHFKAAQKINFSVEAKHRKPMIGVPLFRWLVLLIPIALAVLAIVGYCQRPDLVMPK